MISVRFPKYEAHVLAINHNDQREIFQHKKNRADWCLTFYNLAESMKALKQELLRFNHSGRNSPA